MLVIYISLSSSKRNRLRVSYSQRWERCILVRKQFSIFSLKYVWAWNICMIGRSCTGISKVRIYLWVLMGFVSWATLESQRSWALNQSFLKHTVARSSTWHLNYWKNLNMVLQLIFGLLVLFFIKCWHLDTHGMTKGPLSIFMVLLMRIQILYRITIVTQWKF